ncbi:MAG: 3-phosphoshikimate 1-carboxyvinyltransferase [Proteobacteria bacterium]|nr:MAG: 3-phosphoshikimate 1-carboxyvinyltransferase [Pseudomonadota bacterium]
MSSFNFKGEIPASKSILNRLLIIQSYSDNLKVVGDSDADDVVKMRMGLKQILRGEPADCGAAGTTLRFLSLRASRISGTHHLSGSLRLFERPQTETARLLTQLDCEAEIRLQRMTIRGQGWQKPEGELIVDRSSSSQFASAVLLNAWHLPFDLRLRFEGAQVSESYLSMTISLCERAGMKIDREGANVLIVRAGSQVTATELIAEPDASSAFAIAAVAVAKHGTIEIFNWPDESLQPDAVFPILLAQMGCDVETSGGVLKITRPAGQPLRAIEFNIKDCPDLFPVLSVLCANAVGKSRLFGAPHLALKESDRIATITDLVKSLGRRARALPDGIEIDGKPDAVFPQLFKFSTDHDHRLAMAGAVAQAAGAKIEILEPRVVNKSYPGFWRAIEESSKP